jgi:hypothetical protein
MWYLEIEEECGANSALTSLAVNYGIAFCLQGSDGDKYKIRVCE